MRTRRRTLRIRPSARTLPAPAPEEGGRGDHNGPTPTANARVSVESGAFDVKLSAATRTPPWPICMAVCSAGRLVHFYQFIQKSKATAWTVLNWRTRSSLFASSVLRFERRFSRLCMLPPSACRTHHSLNLGHEMPCARRAGGSSECKTVQHHDIVPSCAGACKSRREYIMELSHGGFHVGGVSLATGSRKSTSPSPSSSSSRIRSATPSSPASDPSFSSKAVSSSWLRLPSPSVSISSKAALAAASSAAKPVANYKTC